MPTIGVSLAVPEPWGRRLQDYRVSLGDESARQIPTHVTLLPPTEAADADMEAIAEHLRTVAGRVAPFPVHLRGTGTFRPVSPVVFVVVVEGISACEQLTALVRSGPLRADLRFPYHPHVTVAHHVPEADLDRAFGELADFECLFEADAFHLYRHDERLGWTTDATFPLTG
ncbi:MAG: 2'-5' RNA ligase family protein [Marmoricola sp.]